MVVLALSLAYVGLSVERQVYPPMVPVQGGSMHPLLRSGDLVFLKAANFERLGKGDVIAFRTTSDVQEKWNVPGSYLHRIVTVQKGAHGKQFQTKGDNVAGMDPFWTIEQNVVGVYASKISNLGYPFLFSHSKQGKILLGGGLLIIFLYWLLGVFERRRIADAVNIYNLATIVDEARRLTARMEEITAPSEAGLPEANMEEVATASPHFQSITPTELPRLKRSLRSYSRKAVRKLYAQMAAEIDQSRHTAERLEHENAAIRQDHDLLKAKLIQSIRRQKSLAISLVAAEELHLPSNRPLYQDKFTLTLTNM